MNSVGFSRSRSSSLISRRPTVEGKTSGLKSWRIPRCLSEIPHFLLLFRSYAWSQKDPQRWYNFGIESPRIHPEKQVTLRDLELHSVSLLFFSPAASFGALSMPHNRTFGGECFESWQWSLVKTCFIPQNLLNPFHPQGLHLPIFFEWASMKYQTKWEKPLIHDNPIPPDKLMMRSQ